MKGNLEKNPRTQTASHTHRDTHTQTHTYRHINPPLCTQPRATACPFATLRANSCWQSEPITTCGMLLCQRASIIHQSPLTSTQALVFLHCLDNSSINYATMCTFVSHYAPSTPCTVVWWPYLVMTWPYMGVGTGPVRRLCVCFRVGFTVKNRLTNSSRKC